MADTRLVVGVVGAPIRTELTEPIRGLVGHLGRTHPIDGIGTRLLADGIELVADLVDRLVPLDALPGAAFELHRVFQAALAADQFAHRGALGAVRAAVDRRVPARLLADPHAVDDFRGDGAADGTMRADALAHGRTGGERSGGGS